MSAPSTIILACGTLFRLRWRQTDRWEACTASGTCITVWQHEIVREADEGERARFEKEERK